MGAAAFVTGTSASGLSTLNKDQIAERGARMARRDSQGATEAFAGTVAG